MPSVPRIKIDCFRNSANKDPVMMPMATSKAVALSKRSKKVAMPVAKDSVIVMAVKANSADVTIEKLAKDNMLIITSKCGFVFSLKRYSKRNVQSVSKPICSVVKTFKS